MTHLLVLPEYTYAGYCSTGGNKDWAACLAVETDDQNISIPTISETTEVVFLSIHGPHGGNLIADQPKKLAMKHAQAHYKKKCREKDGKAYDHVLFTPYIPAFGRPLGLSLAVVAENTSIDGASVVSNPKAATSPALSHPASAVKAIEWAKLQQVLASSDYGVTEKVNGERCLLVFDGQHLLAYNRKGQQMSAPPIGATHLCRLGCPFVIDGERLTGEQGGHYVAFDLLEWNNQAFTAFSYVLRITTLEDAMLQAGLLVADRSTPTYQQAQANSTEATLALLVAVTGAEIAQRAMEEVQLSSGEGVIIRKLLGSYYESPLKFKFVSDIDAFVFDTNEGIAAGSLKLGLIRSSDKAVIEVANVRSGLTNENINEVRAMLERGERPVFTVTYLPKRTIGIQLVEPRTSMAFLRTDKDAAECTTDQYGAEKAIFISQAKPVDGITLS